MTWQPIETAPRDGTVIDLWFVGDWNCRMPDAEWSESLGAWFVRGRHSSYLDGPLITHWMPLPAPPEPAPDADAAFLTEILTRARAGGKTTHEEIARLKRLADWADAPPCPGWDGTLDVGETERAVAAAKRRMRCPT
jgi:hypothetical protein